jgi:hypothetical protein
MDTKPEPLLRANGVRKIYRTGAVSVVALADLGLRGTPG